jgi:hypothetical protein
MLEQSYTGNSKAFILYGAIVALGTLGFYTDLIAQRNLYTLVTLVILFQCACILTQVLYEALTGNIELFLRDELACFIAGYFYTLTTVLLI